MGRCARGLAAIALTCSLGASAVAQTTSYKYDALGRLISITYPNGATNNYSYDAAGNRTVAVISVPTQSPLTMTTQSLPSGVVGTPYSQAIVVSGGAPPITFSTGDLPYAGLALNASTGVINGTPTTVGTFSVFVSASDVNGETVGQEFSITISP